MSTENRSAAGERSQLVGWLLTIAGLLLAALVASLSLWLTPVVGAALVAMGLIGLSRVPRPLALVTTVFGCVLLGLGLLAFAPAFPQVAVHGS